MLIHRRFLISMACLSMQAALAALAMSTAQANPAEFLQASEPMQFRVNGLSLDVRSALVAMPRESLVQAILAGWRDAGHQGLSFSPSEDRTVLGRQIGALHETLTLLSTDDPLRTAIVLATQDVRQVLGTAPPPPFGLPAGLRIIDTIEEINGNEPTVTYRMDSDLPTRESIERLRASLVSAAWTVDSRTLSGRGPSMMEASRGSQKLVATALVASRGQPSRVVVQVTGRAP